MQCLVNTMIPTFCGNSVFYKHSKISNTFSLCSQNKMLVLKAGINKKDVRIAKREVSDQI